MEPEQSAPHSFILGHVPLGIALIDATTLRVLYVNSYLTVLLDPAWHTRNVSGHTLQEILAPDLLRKIEPPLREAYRDGTVRHYDDLPYEGSLETRGRTYWHVTIVPTGRESIDSSLLRPDF